MGNPQIVELTVSTDVFFSVQYSQESLYSLSSLPSQNKHPTCETETKNSKVNTKS